MAESPDDDLGQILRTDEAVLGTVITAHATRHACTDGSCDALRVLSNAHADIRDLRKALDGD